MEGRTFAERLTYSGVNMQGQFELEELEQLHKFLIKEITAQYGAPAAVKVRRHHSSEITSRSSSKRIFTPPAMAGRLWPMLRLLLPSHDLKCHRYRSARSWARRLCTWSSTAR